MAAAVVAAGLISCGSAPKAENTSSVPQAPAVQETENKAETTAESENTTEATEAEFVYVPYEPTGDITLLDDFEDGLYWSFVGESWNDGDKSVNADLTEDWGSEGPSSLKCEFKSDNTGKWEKAGFLCEGASLIEQNWQGAKTILFDVNNTNAFDIDVMMVTQAGENWESWNQTGAFKCPAGEVTAVYFNISSQKHLEMVNRLIIYQCGNDNGIGGSFMIDNVRLEF